MSKDNIHFKHRQRLRQRFYDGGIESFQAHEALELLLYYSIPRSDTNQLAHQLINHFGGITAVFGASIPELISVHGIGLTSALLISLVGGIMRRYLTPPPRPLAKISNLAQAGEYAQLLLGQEKCEVLYMLCLDNSNRLIRERRLAQGTISEVSIHPRKITEAVLLSDAANIILIHTHPGGVTRPTEADIHFTQHIALVLMSIGIGVLDHVIVNEEGYFSFTRNGEMAKIRQEVNIRIKQLIPNNAYQEFVSQSSEEYRTDG